MDVEGAVARIEHLLKLEKYDAARLAIDAGLRIEPEERWLHLCRAELELLDGDRKHALELADRLIGGYPDWCRPQYLKNRILTALEDYQGAEIAIRAALAVSPYSPGYLARLAHVQLCLHDVSGALASATAALAISPVNVLALNVRSRALVREGRAEEASAAYEAALAAAPDDPYTHFNFANHLRLFEDYAGAREHYRIALRLKPGLDQARNAWIETIKTESRIYRAYRRLVAWSDDPQARGGLSSLVMVGGSMGGMALLKSLPFSLTVQYLLFGFIVMVVLLGFRRILEPITNWLVYVKPGHRILLAQRVWRLTFAVTAALTAGLAGAVAFLGTGGVTALAVMTYSLTLIIPAHALFGDRPPGTVGRRLAVVLPPLAALGIAATVTDLYATIWYAVYAAVLGCLLGVLTRPR